MMADQQDVFSALPKDSGEPTWERAVARAREEVDRLDNITLNIAVTGETGAGKSSLVNAFRGLKDTDEGAAPTGVTETTMESTMYPHPTMPNVIFWDLPGIGTKSFKAETYMNDVKFQNYDFFIIVSASRFTENTINLANEIKKNKKNFYFVRTKTDFDVENENKRKNIGEETTLKKIRKECVEHLSTLGSPPVFLISSHYLERFDFQKLVNKLGDDLPEHKKYAMIMSLPVFSQQCLDEKYSEFKKYTWAVAITSGAVTFIPVPGVATAYDVIVVMSFLTKCYYSFGLDDGSLQKLSDRVNKPILEQVKESGLVWNIFLNKSFAASVAARMKEAFSLEKMCILGTAVESFVSTQSVLLEGVTEMYEVAKRVLEMADIP